MTGFGLSELELENKKVRKTFFHFKNKWYHTKNVKCPFLNQGDVPYRKTKFAFVAYFVDFFCKQNRRIYNTNLTVHLKNMTTSVLRLN